MIFEHIPIMADKCIEGLNIKENGIYVDATIGGAGHSALIADKLKKDGMLIGIDRDREALNASRQRLSKYKCRIELIHSDYSKLKSILEDLHIDKVDGILADLGVSSYQFDNPERGFSYRFDSPLDMRMDQNQKITAKDIVNGYEFERLLKVIRDYGEENYAYSIAKNIVKRREQKPIETTFELVDIINGSMPKKVALKGPHKAKRTFQAIRIEVNNELEILKEAIDGFFDCLNKNGRLAIISFHSLEDRIVKTKFNEYASGCICPKELPVCVCNNMPSGKIITKRPAAASTEEIEKNPRSTSAKLRIIEKI